jgi:hypothetical protein
VTFSWGAVTGADGYRLLLGYSPGTNDIRTVDTNATSVTLSGLPNNGRTIYVQLTARFLGETATNLYNYTASGTLVGGASVTAFSSEQPVEVPQNQPARIALSAHSVDNNPLMFAIVEPPSHGRLSGLTADTLTYTPDPGYTGSDSFYFKANDGADSSNIAKIEISVQVPPSVSLSMPAQDSDSFSSRAVKIEAASSGDNADIRLTNPPGDGPSR